jgi:formate dehydrogenase iron-sulfur subunit
MYVLKHADRPEIYSNLAKNPQISALVEVWKGWSKPFALLGIGVAALVGFMHYVAQGPNEVSEDDEEQGKRALGGR